MVEASLATGEEWGLKNAEVDEMMHRKPEDISKFMFDTQIKQTASRFAVDMLILKFIQGIPIIGIIGGVSNPIYYNKIMKYVELKYRKRYYQNKVEAKDD